MKKGILILLAVLAVAGGGYAVARQQISRRTAGVDALHEAVLYDYRTLVKNAESSTVTVTEGTQTVGAFTLSELGVLDATVQDITASYSAEDRMDSTAFHARKLSEKVAWAKNEHPKPKTYPVNMQDYSDAPLGNLLAGLPRTAAEDAYPVFNGHGYEIVDAKPGNELDTATVLEALRSLVERMEITASSAAAATLDLAELNCYLPPSITAENQSFDLDGMLRERLSDLEITVDLNLDGQNLPEKYITLGFGELSPYIALDENAQITVDEEGLAARTAHWAPLADAEDVEYILNSFVDGPKPISFLRASYTLDAQELAEQIAEHLRTLSGGEVEATFFCTTPEGDPFPLGDTYIEVDIDNQHMTFFRNGKPVTDTDVVTGNLNGYRTITGLYFAENKETNVTMKGEDYCVFSEYWIGVEGPYGIHDASWRKHFGWDFYVNGGSHGCVNVPKEVMPEFFSNTEVGTPILIYGKNEWYEPDPEVTRIQRDPNL